MIGDLATEPALARPDLLAPSVHAALVALGPLGLTAEVAAIDPDLADTAAFCAAYRVAPQESANCVVVAGRRGETVRLAACVVLATTRADVNTVARRRLDARRCSFAALDEVEAAAGMSFGGITPVGLPATWPVLVDAAVVAAPFVVVGSGLRGSKLRLRGSDLLLLAGAEAVEGLGRPAPDVSVGAGP